MRPLGPDAQRYIAAGTGQPVTRPFHLRWLLPALCGASRGRWWTVWGTSWIVLATSMGAWAYLEDLTPIQIVCAIGLLCGLPGILGPKVSIPVQVDLPATALTLAGVVAFATHHPVGIIAGFVLIGIAATIRETSPIAAALWMWNPIALVLLVIPAIAALARTPATSSGIPEWDRIHDHPIATSLEYHRGQWRDARIMILPWGLCLAGLYAADWQLIIILLIAYTQLVVATDSVRLYQHLAGPALALAAAATIPGPWVPLALAGHLFWIWKPERI